MGKFIKIKKILAKHNIDLKNAKILAIDHDLQNLELKVYVEYNGVQYLLTIDEKIVLDNNQNDDNINNNDENSVNVEQSVVSDDNKDNKNNTKKTSKKHTKNVDNTEPDTVVITIEPLNDMVLGEKQQIKIKNEDGVNVEKECIFNIPDKFKNIITVDDNGVVDAIDVGEDVYIEIMHKDFNTVTNPLASGTTNKFNISNVLETNH